MQALAQRRAFARDPDVLRRERAPVPSVGGNAHAPSGLDAPSSNDEIFSASSRSSITMMGEVVDADKEKAREVAMDDDPFLVGFEDGSPHNPQNWSIAYRWFVTALISHTSLIVGAASSINSGSVDRGAKALGVSGEVMALDTALYLVGFGISSPLLGPLSEVSGRNPVYIVTLLVFVLFEIGCALSPNIQTRCVLRFFAGCAGSTPLANAGGSFTDMWTSEARTYTLPIYAAVGFLGPVIGPIIGGYIGQSKLVGYEWCDWVSAIWGAFALLSAILFMPETFGPSILKMKAQELRKATGDDRYTTSLERLRLTVPFSVHFKEAVSRPFLLAYQEPIVLLFSIYLSVVYIILFGDFIAYPVIYKSFGLTPGQLGLCFIPIAIGLAIIAAFTPLIIRAHRSEKRRVHAETGLHELQPEERLRVAMLGTWLVPISLFWFAWTCYHNLTIWPALASQVLLGGGILCCFISSYLYIIDAYSTMAASALATLTIFRYVVSGAAVMFTGPMFEAMGTHWALTFLGILSLICSVIPWCFYYYGPRIRSWSRFTPATAL